jgi:dienelactone hydrolase
MMVSTSDIDYSADGSTLIGRLALPDGQGKRPAVLIAHEGGGLDDYQKSRAERFANLGYVAFALDYHGGGRPLTDRDEMAARCQALWSEPERIRALAGAGLEVLVGEPRSDASRLAAVGYCFHPRLATRRPHDAANIKGKVLVCVGTEDPLISVPERLAFEEEMRAGGVDWRMNLYGGAGHSFTRPGAELDGVAGISHHQLSDERSWRAMLDLFHEVFG